MKEVFGLFNKAIDKGMIPPKVQESASRIHFNNLDEPEEKDCPECVYLGFDKECETCGGTGKVPMTAEDFESASFEALIHNGELKENN